MTLRGIRTTHLLLSGQMSYPVRLEGHQNERLASECIITDANRYICFWSNYFCRKAVGRKLMVEKLCVEVCFVENRS